MLNSDTHAADFVTFLDAIEVETRLTLKDRNMLTAYRNKLSAGNTTVREDMEILGILQRWFTKITKQ
jgi:hypothetical protein